MNTDEEWNERIRSLSTLLTRVWPRIFKWEDKCNQRRNKILLSVGVDEQAISTIPPFFNAGGAKITRSIVLFTIGNVMHSASVECFKRFLDKLPLTGRMKSREVS